MSDVILRAHPGARELLQRINGLAAAHLEKARGQLRRVGREGVISGG